MNNLTNISRYSLDRLVKHKAVLIFLIKILIAAGLLFFLISKINPGELIIAFTNAKLHFLLLSFSLLALNLYLQFKKWEITCSNILEERDKKKIIRSLFAGLSGGAFTPARIGEYFGRAVEFKNKPLLQITVATFIDKFYPLVIVAFIGSVSSILFLHFYYSVSLYLTLSLFILLFAIFYLLIYLMLRPGLMDIILEKIFPKDEKYKSLFEASKYFGTIDRKYSMNMVLLSLSFYLCYIFQYAFLVAAFSENFHPIRFIWAGNLVMFAKTLIPSISFAELGVREGASIYFLGQMGEISAVAFNAAITLFFINVLLPSVAGLFFLFKKDNA